MNLEIERKFLVVNEDWRSSVTQTIHILQGYLGGDRCSVRVRVAGEAAWLSVKSAQAGIIRQEYEYSIPLKDAQRMLETLCSGRLEKHRHHITYAGQLFEVDEFLGENQGLIVAELELQSPDQPYVRPLWLGREVSNLPHYYNATLVKHPYSQWSTKERDEC